VYPVLKAMEEAGQIRRGYFVAGLGATQFAAGGADDRLRALREPPETAVTTVLSATDPANPYGTIIPWPPLPGERLERRAGARVFLRDGELVAFLMRNERTLVTFPPAEGRAPQDTAPIVARLLAGLVESGERPALLIARIDGREPADSSLAPHLAREGFRPGSAGFLKRGGHASVAGRESVQP
jgi:ATP-dependent Lhr-like helicase